LPLTYEGRTAVLATRHRKEEALAPALARLTGLALHVPEDLDTDSLGTFTGEVARPASMRETARMKARLGIEASGLPLALASEGSFGPHPALPFAAAAHEMLLFLDVEQGIEIAEARLSPETNFAALDLAEANAGLDAFLLRAGFPAHGLVLRAGERVIKGIQDRAALDRAIAEAGTARPLRLETDMRAHMNPTRMGEIAALGESLARRLATPCPSCAAPGFGTLRTEPGLACEDCGAPTALVRAIVHGCARCAREETRPRPDGRQTATPAECQECNP
jgi:hypothetical protein